MRINVLGTSAAAKTLRGHLGAFSAVVVTDEKPDFTLTVATSKDAQASVNGVHGLFEAHIVNHLASALGSVLVKRAEGTRDDELTVTLPAASELVSERAIFRALTDGLIKKLPPPPIPPKPWYRRWFGLLILLALPAQAQTNVFMVKCNNGTISFWCSDSATTSLRVRLVASDVATGGTASSFGAAFPATGTASGFSDGTNMQGARVFDLDSGGGTQYNLGFNLRATGAGGSTEVPFPAALAGLGGFKVECLSGCGGAATFADNAAFTFGTTPVNIGAGVFDDTAPNALTENSAGAYRLSSRREIYSQIRDAAGNERGANVTAGNALVVDGSASTQPVSATNLDIRDLTSVSDSVSVTDGAGALNVIVDSGTVTANAGTDLNTSALLTTTAHNDAFGTAGAADAQVRTVQGVAGMTPVVVGDGAGSLNVIVDSGAVTTTGAAADGAAVSGNPVLIAGQDGTNAQSIKTDTTGSVQVDIESSVAIAVDTTSADQITPLGTAADGAAVSGNPLRIGGKDGSGNTQDIATDTAGELQVDVLSFPDNEPVNAAQRGGVAVVAGACERETLLYIQISQTTGTQLITGTASERIYICSIQLMTATAQNIALVDGTGSVCATGPTGLLGGSTAATGWNFAANGGIVLPPTRDSYTKTSTDADNVCLLQSGAGQVSGSLTYISIPNI